MSEPTNILPTILPLGVRVVSRYLVGALVAIGVFTAAQGETIVGDPAVQAIISGVLGAAAAWAIETATVLARRWGKPT